MSFFDRQGISVALLLLQLHAERGEAQTNQRDADDDSDDESEDDTSQSSAGDDKFRDAVTVLRNFCFISVDTSGTSFEMHVLVQLAMWKWLEDNSELEQWKEQFISNLCAAFPTGEYENWATCQELFAHAKAAVGQQPEDKSSKAEWATVLYRAAWFAGETGKIADAKALAMKAMKARKEVLGQGHDDTLMSTAMVGLSYKLEGRWDDAEKLEVQVMERSKTKLGADHPDTLNSMANLASTYWKQYRYDDAEVLMLQVTETSKTKFGSDHPDTLRRTNNLTVMYKHQGRWGDVQTLDARVMERRKRKLEVDH
jgi:hypothetical protein